MKALLIPSALLMPLDMQNKFGEIPMALFPLGNKPMIENIYNKYKGIVDVIYIVVKKKKILINNYIESKKLPIQVVELDTLDDLGYTVCYGLDMLLKQNPLVDYVYINFADSLLEDEMPIENMDFIYYICGTKTNKWTYFNFSKGRITDIVDKCDETEAVIAGNLENIFAGIFGFADPKYFLELLKQFKSGSDIDSFYRAVDTYSQKNPFKILQAISWLDVGHSENYSKAKTNVAARSFNLIEIDERRGILKKRSENKEKLVNEIRWYLRVPNKLQYLLPRIYDYSLDLTDPYVSMEYYGYHTLHESLVFGNLSLVKWHFIFRKILFAIEDMSKFTVSDESKQFEFSMRNVYLQKTYSRLGKIRYDKDFQIFFEKTIIINKKEYRTLEEYMELLPQLVEDLLIKTFEGQFNIIHGDLCLANILIEDTYGFIRIIDPRGRFGAFDIYGDVRYELAKLLHSLEGKYDFIIEDMFDINVNSNIIEYHSHKSINNIIDVFVDVFHEIMGNIRAVRLIEATLFLGMIPLHSDFKLRQFAMLATGVQLLEQVICDIEG